MLNKNFKSEECDEQEYIRGLETAVRLIDKLYDLNEESRRTLFGYELVTQITYFIPITEIERKLNEFEEQKRNEIKVGDEVYYDDTTTIVITKVHKNMLSGFSRTGEFKYFTIKDFGKVKKTGRHFYEVKQVLNKLWERSNAESDR